MKKVKRKYLCHPDRKDYRDLMFKVSAPGTKIPLPKSVDLRPLQSPVMDQGSLGACSAFALSSLIDYVHIKNNLPPINPSKLFIYWNERALIGTENSDSGACLRDGIKSIASQGAAKEICWPYDIKKFKTKPPEQCYQEALKEKALEYHRLNTIEDMKRCLAEGNCFIGGLTIFSSFEGQDVAKSGMVPMPGLDDSTLGGHALSFVGYTEDGKFIVKNSWGIGWGLGGYCLVPEKYLETLGNDFWTITSIE